MRHVFPLWMDGLSVAVANALQATCNDIAAGYYGQCQQLSSKESVAAMITARTGPFLKASKSAGMPNMSGIGVQRAGQLAAWAGVELYSNSQVTERRISEAIALLSAQGYTITKEKA